MSNRNLLREERTQHLAQSRWLILMALAALALTLIASSLPASQAAMPIEQVYCDPDGQPPFGMIPADIETANVYPSNMLHLVGCMNPATPVAESDAEPEATDDHGVIEPMALH